MRFGAAMIALQVIVRPEGNAGGLQRLLISCRRSRLLVKLKGSSRRSLI